MSKDKSKKLQGLNTDFNSKSGLLPYGTGKSIPLNFKATRTMQLSPVERDLFTDIEDNKKGDYVITLKDKEIRQKVSEFDLSSFTFAVAQILFNQSYYSGNEDLNSGVGKEEDETLSNMAGKSIYKGEIHTTLYEICKLAYGVDIPGTKQKKAMETLIDVLHETPVEITIPNVGKAEATLCARINKFTREDGAISYTLYLHPIFTENIKNNFVEFPQNIMKRLSQATDRKTVAHLRLIRLLSSQKKDPPFVRTIPVLIEELGLEDAYRKDIGRTEKQLLSIFKSMEDIGIIKEFPTIEYTMIRGKRRIGKVTFILNKKFTRIK